MPADFSDVQNLPSDSRFLDVLHERVVVADGAMGTMIGRGLNLADVYKYL